LKDRALIPHGRKKVLDVVNERAEQGRAQEAVAVRGVAVKFVRRAGTRFEAGLKIVEVGLAALHSLAEIHTSTPNAAYAGHLSVARKQSRS